MYPCSEPFWQRRVGLVVQDIMTREVITLEPGDTVATAVATLRSHRIRHLPIVENGLLVGILTDRDVKRAMPSLLEGITQEKHEEILGSSTVSRIMTREPMTTSPLTPVKQALDAMIEHRYGALPVLEHGRVVGMLTQSDFLRLLRTLL